MWPPGTHTAAHTGANALLASTRHADDAHCMLPGGWIPVPAPGLVQVLAQEVQRVNALLGVMRTSLTELGKAVRGLALMGAELEAVGTALFDGKVPALWMKRSFPSLKVRARLGLGAA